MPFTSILQSLRRQENRYRSFFYNSKSWWQQFIHPSKEVLKIDLENINRTTLGMYYVGGRGRLAGLTDVHFIGSDMIVCASLVGQYLALLRFDIRKKSYSIIDSITTVSMGSASCVDLIDFDGNDRIVTSNSDLNNASIYRIVEGRLQFDQDVNINGMKPEFCHGARFLPWNPDVICLITTKTGRKVIFIEIKSQEIIYMLTDPEWKPKDVCFVSPNRMIVVYANSNATAKASQTLSPGKIQVIEFNLEIGNHQILSEFFVNECHFDSCIIKDGKLYLTDQALDSVFVYKYQDDVLYPHSVLKGFNLPHGIDIHPDYNLLAVTNYGDNSISIRKIQ